ncbi:hypothetical protein GRF29_164g1390648 [Pseudopithomyces chartarum]|uniref:Protein kinase domain-containing protein n=1 Tax=Pseudopithomyces chartarum TaxID=1892770 RepID=A0AAN6LPS3_9PLEO|nr:hypothetical protein GRF29_164g1390648 [Pseudopithomyces chartarum]
MEFTSKAKVQSLPSSKRETLTVRAERLGMAPSTLWYHENGRCTPKEKCENQGYLSSPEEQALLQHVSQMAASGSPLMWAKNLGDLAFEIACHRPTTEKFNPPGKNWGVGFVRRHPDIPIRRRKNKKSNESSQGAGRVRKTRYGKASLDTAATVRLLEELNLNPTLSVPTTPSSKAISGASAKQLESIFREKRTAFTDAEIMKVSTLLSYTNLQYSKLPRTYIVLRSINRLDLLDRIILAGFSDFLFPASDKTLPAFLDQSIRKEFCNSQHLILTKSMDLEKGQEGKHCHFKKGDELLLEERGALGHGSYGQVDKVVSLISFKEYARKRVHRAFALRGREKKGMLEFINEIQIAKRLKHNHIVQFVGSYTDMEYLGLIMSPVAEMNLAEYFKQCTTSGHPQLRLFFGCLAMALEYLHSQGVRHKDIKPNNILIKGGQVFLADFGLSFYFADVGCSTTTGVPNGQTRRYAAPEVVQMEDRNRHADIWSLGVVFIEMIAILKGWTVQDMDNFLLQHGSHHPHFYENIPALSELTEELGGIGRVSDNRALVWTQQMLTPQQQFRPTASSLVESILESDGFCGICCTSREGSDLSDFHWEDEQESEESVC